MTYNKNNPFYKIINENAPAEKIYENDSAIVINNLYPKAKIHLLAIPKGSYTSFTEFGLQATDKEKLDFINAVNEAIKIYKLDETGGYRLAANTGDNAGQSVPHFHLHIVGGEKLINID